MIIVDANILIDHLRVTNARLVSLLKRNQLLFHPYTIGELALGSFADRTAFLEQLTLLPQATVALHADVMALTENHHLSGTGIGYVDCHLLAAALMTAQGAVWTRDKRLHAQAERLGVAYITLASGSH